MIFDVITIFPSMFDGPMSASVIGIAQERGLLEVRTHDLRQWTHDRHRTTDDEPYGGGPGMVMKAGPIFEAIDAVQSAEDEPGHVIFLTPSGVPFTQKLAVDLASLERLVFVCGRYEGIDERALARGSRAFNRRLRADRWGNTGNGGYRRSLPPRTGRVGR